MPKNCDALDLYSTCQTKKLAVVDYFTGEYIQRTKTCDYGSPLVAYILAGKGYLSQGNCNHWDCSRCGLLRASHEYRRIVDGCEQLEVDHTLYFWTLTCLGRDMSLEQAERDYLEWTNTLLTNARTKAKRSGLYWCYVQVTERQKKTRAHPHSHLITTFLPDDARETKDSLGKTVIVSEWFSRANYSAGLGAQHKITKVQSAAAVSRYVAKYLFKDTFRDKFPPKWKRIRYSRNFPPLTSLPLEFSTQLFSAEDWRQLDKQKITFECESYDLFTLAAKHSARVSAPRH